MKLIKLIFLSLLFVAFANGQTKTPRWGLPLFEQHTILASGSKTDTAATQTLNNLSTRLEDYLTFLTSTVTKAYSYSLADVDSDVVWIVPVTNLNLVSVYAVRIGGTSSVINVTRTRSSTTVDCLTANYTTTTSAASAGTVQNGAVTTLDVLKVTVRAISGQQKLHIQLNFKRTT
jgi:hypothetical protein